MSKFTNIAVAAAMAVTVVGTSMATAEAGSRKNRNIALGVGAALLGAVIINNRARARHQRRHVRDCWIEREEYWSNRRGRYVVRKVRVCQ